MQQQREREAWDFALGLIKVDDLQPEPDFLQVIQQNIRGEITDEEVHAWLLARYTQAGTCEADHRRRREGYCCP